MIRTSLKGVALALMLAAGGASALAQGTAITYQGQLKNAGVAVDSPTDVRFQLFTAASGGSQVGSTVTVNAVDVNQGLFTTPVDFGVNPYAAFNQTYFLQIAVRNPAGSGSFVPMGSRQALTPAPFSLATRGINVGNGGRVGIGTDTPSRLLGLGGGIQIDRFENNDGTRQPSIGLLNTNMLTFGFDNAGEGIGSSRTAGSVNRLGLDFFTSFERRLSITQSGNVGIGTTTPAAPLDVMGNLRVLSNGTIRNQAVASTFGNHNGLIETFYADNDRFGMAQLPAGKLALYSGDVFGGSAVQIGTMTGASTFAPSMTVARGGNVGIGTSDPQARLHTVGTTRLDGTLQFGASLQNGNTLTFNRVDVGAGNTFAVLDIAPATVASSSSFIINRNGANVFIFQLDGRAGKPGGGTWSVLSDERTKTDIQPMTGTLDRLLQLKGHAYTYKPEFVEDGRALPGVQIGLVAQEVETVFPDWVSTGPDGMKQVTERSTTALMVEALRDLRAEKDAQIATKNAQITTLEERLAKIEAMLAVQASQQK